MSGRQIPDDDRPLVDGFRALRERERGRVPSFERVLGRQPSRPPVRRWAPALLVAAMFMLALGVWRERGQGAEETVAFRIEAGQLRTPTDFLLDLAGPELAGGVPSFGRIDDWFGLPALDEHDAGTPDESERL
jgi:hypothetical protein